MGLGHHAFRGGEGIRSLNRKRSSGHLREEPMGDGSQSLLMIDDQNSNSLSRVSRPLTSSVSLVATVVCHLLALLELRSLEERVAIPSILSWSLLVPPFLKETLGVERKIS